MSGSSTVRVGHLTETRPASGFLWWGEEKRYRVFTVQVRRPAEGVELVDLRCKECDAELLLRVRGTARSRLIRRRYLVTAAVGLAVVVVAVAIGFGSEYAGATIPLGTALGTILLLAFLAGSAATAIGVYAWRHEEPLALYNATGPSAGEHRLVLDDDPLLPVID